MFVRVVAPLAVLLTSLALMLGACSGDSPGAAGIPPCVPATGSTVDPCDPDAPPAEMGTGAEFVPNLGDEPFSIRRMLDDGRSVAWVTHIVVRGTYIPNTVRCAGGDPFRVAAHAKDGFSGTGDQYAMKCYADVRTNSYVVGSGPATLTAMFLRLAYFHDQYGSIFEYEEGHDIHDDALLLAPLYEDLLSGREFVLFLGPPADISSEVWRVMGQWDVQRRDDGTVVAIHPDRDLWRRIRSDDYPAHQAALEMTLPALTQAVTTAHQARVAEHGGRIGADASLPMLITNVGRSQLRQFYTDAGAYDPGVPAPAQPPPPCGLSVPDQADNPGLMRDCFTLLGAKDELRGTGALNWDTGTAIASWDGVTVAGTPQRVTKLKLENKDLTGTIPWELTGLTALTELKLSGNALGGCIHPGLKAVASHDLDSLGLLYCPPAPGGLTGTATETSVALRWSAVSNAGKYRVEYRTQGSSGWTLAVDTLTGTSHTVTGLNCESAHWFRVSAYGSGPTYAAAWSDWSAALMVDTGECVPPASDQDA